MMTIEILLFRVNIDLYIVIIIILLCYSAFQTCNILQTLVQSVGERERDKKIQQVLDRNYAN